jgi:hypothetical protein
VGKNSVRKSGSIASKLLTPRYNKRMKHNPLGTLIFMSVLHFISMYALMYMMVDRLENVLPNLNQVYMAAVMTAPMVIFEVLLMGSMFPGKTLKAGLIGAGSIALVVFSLLIRNQTAIGDKELLRSMIPHHAGAILMCEKARLEDPENIRLCRLIIETQKQEIGIMKRKLSE